MARPGQVEYIDDLMERLDLAGNDLPDDLRPRPGYGFDTLPDTVASELIEWLQDYDPKEHR